MDNPLTPNKIQRLIHLAEDKSFNIDRRLLTEEDVNLILSSHMNAPNRSFGNNGESSSGILDLDKVKAFGESDIGILSLSKSTAFIPGEMSGRSTGAEDLPPACAASYGRHSLMLDSLTQQMNKQTAEVNDIMRHSIASNFSFHSKRDLSADEQSLIAREAPIPVQHNYVNISENGNNSDLSVGAYFKNRCPDFGKLLGRTESPDKSNIMPSITEVSSSAKFDICKETLQIIAIDDTLDSVPVRQPRSPNKQRIPQPKKVVQKIPVPVNKVLNQPEIPTRVSLAKSEKNIDPPACRIPTKSVNINPAVVAHKSFMTSSKPADVVLKNLHSSIKFVTEDTEGSVENSFSLSKIADYLGKQSNISITDMLQLQKKNKKQPLTELHLNTPNVNEPEVQVTALKDSKKAESASSAATINTVISAPLDNLKLTENVPNVIVKKALGDNLEDQYIETPKRTTRSKSPSSRSQTTLSTVRENISSFKSGDSPGRESPGEAIQTNMNRSKVPSPNIVYKELDKSVDWQEVLQQKPLQQHSLAKEKWAEIETASVDGFVGVMTTVKIAVTTNTDSWITGKFEFTNLPNDGRDLRYELPRRPILLSPRKTEYFVINLTSSAEMRAILPYTICLKDTALDAEATQRGTIQANFKLPSLQAISADGDERVTFPTSHEKAQLCKSFILASDCPADLQLKLSVSEGDGIFSIRAVQEIKKTDINKVSLEPRVVVDDKNAGKSKVLGKQLCRLANGNAIKVTILFTVPSLLDPQLDETTVALSGVLNVNLFGVETVLTRVDLAGAVGRANLTVNASSSKLCLTNESIKVDVINMGSLPGSWLVKMKVNTNAKLFKINPYKFELVPGENLALSMWYIGNEDIEGTVIFEETASGTRTNLEVVGIAEKNTTFPIKTNHLCMSWDRPGRKEISFKSSVDKKIQIRCHIIGDGFSIDLPGGESRGVIIPFSPSERRVLPIVFSPNTGLPCIAILQLMYDKTSDATRTIKLYGCASGECVGWSSGLVTYGYTALVRACLRAPVELKLYNKAHSPAFISTSMHFNLQYHLCESSSRLIGGRCIIPARSNHRVSLRVDWASVEKRAREGASTALGRITVLAGAEYTRRRILRIIRDNGVPDTSLLPEHLKVLAKHFEGEDPAIDKQLKDFNESKMSLKELISGLQELTAQIDLPQDFADGNSTIIIGEDTMIDHNTICE